MSTINTNDRAVLASFINDCVSYQTNSARLDTLKSEQAELITKNGELRKAIVPVFKALDGIAWAKLKKDIKTAIEEAGIKDVDGLLGVLKTAHEYKIMPTQQNADRLRKAKTWVNWNGVVVPNTYKSVHAPKVEPIAEPNTTATASEPAKTESAPAPKVQPKPSVKGSPAPIASNVSATNEPALSADELWAQLCTQFMQQPISMIVFETIENTHKLPRGTIVAEFAKARNRVLEHVAKNTKG